MNDSSKTDPIALFNEWHREAIDAGLVQPMAMALATADASGAPSLRMVLLKGVDERGFVFYTNLLSRKGVEIDANPRAALCFYWAEIDRQVRIEGPVSLVSEAEADAYFASRDRSSRIGAWASKQSQSLDRRFVLEARIAKFAARHGVGEVPRPPYWSGYRVAAESMEFWRQRSFRLHQRILYRRATDGWTTQMLFP